MNSVEASLDLAERRTRSDRRSFTWRTVFYGFLRSRRRSARRDSEAEPLFTDYHHPWHFFLATSIMVLSFADAAFTLALIERGAIEINPVMAAMIARGAQTFATVKMLMTSFGILSLVFLARWMFVRRFRTGVLLTVFFGFYAILVCYEFLFLLQYY
ncbi:MAG: DUF5658 family protein [Woeseiaceae bacterium]|nr:DUF5658 family protein [Woeseiaceae bacterium]